MQITLPIPLPANIAYDRVLVQNAMPDDDRQCWTFHVYGIPVGSDDAMPLVLQTAHRGVVRFEAMSVSYDEIAAANVELGNPVGTVNRDVIAAAAWKQIQYILTSELPQPEPQPEPEA